MNAWVQVDASFRTHRKTKRLARSLGKDARWVPVWLWLYCVESARDGDLSKLTDADLADVLDYTGKPEKLRAALVEAEFLTDAGVVVGWEERYSAKFKFYKDRATKAASARWERNPSPSTPFPIGKEETRLDENRGEEINKHPQASLKDATSIPTPHPASWPVSLSDEQIGEIYEATGKHPKFIVEKWPEFRDRKIRFKDDYATEGLAGFRDYLRRCEGGESAYAGAF